MTFSRFIASVCLIALPVSALSLSGCSSSRQPTTASEQVSDGYARAEALIKKGDYRSAVLVLEPILFTSRATALEDDVLFRLGQAYYHTEQYLLAADMFTKVQQLPASPYAATAQFMVASSYEKMSPPFELDQAYTQKAIEEFALYRELYPLTDSVRSAEQAAFWKEMLKVDAANETYKKNYAQAMVGMSRSDSVRYAGKAITTLREKLAHNAYSVALHYQQLGKLKAATIFLDEVIARYPDTSYYKLAMREKVDLLVKREKWYDAALALAQYQQLAPENGGALQSLQEQIARNTKK